MERLPVRQLVRHWTLYSQPLNHTPLVAATKHEHYHHSRIPVRHFTKGNQPSNRPKGFFEKVLDNIKNEFSQNKEIKENLEKFRRETQKLEETEALKQAREKYRKVEEESMKDVNEVLQTARDTLKSRVDKAKEAEIFKKTMEIGDKISTRAKDAAEGISKQGEYLKESSAYKKMSEASRTVEKELDEADVLSSLYKPPKELLLRSERSTLNPAEKRVVEPNEEVQSVELHKDSKWSENWKKFKDENAYVNKVFEIKTKFDESDNPLVRVTRGFVDRVSDTIGGLFQTTDLSNVLTEICKVDPSFDINAFLIDCEKFIIPTILESMCRGRMDILKDWCHEAVFNVLSNPQKEAEKLGLTIHSKILDLQNIELAMGKMMDQGPVLVLTFQAQQLTFVKDKKGNVVEGDPDKIVQNTYVMAFCRDQNDLDPKTAWRLIDVAMQQSQFMF